MRSFLFDTVKFFVAVMLLLVFSLFFIPDTVSKNNLLAAITDKHQLLKNAGEKKIVFVGGSNVSFGLDSKKIVERFNIPVINMGIHGGLGLKYVVNDIKPYINTGDIIIMTPEYENFYTDNFYGEMELVALLFDIDPAGKKLIDAKQWMHLFKYIPTYSAKKIKNYLLSLLHKQKQPKQPDIYSKESFNQYGDAYIHWTMPDQNFMLSKKNPENEQVNPEVISFIVNFEKYVENKGAQLIILPPVIESQSFSNQEEIINLIAAALIKKGIPFLCKPERYKFSKDYFFNSFYHTNKKGVDLRTQLVIEDLGAVLNRNYNSNSYQEK